MESQNAQSKPDRTEKNEKRNKSMQEYTKMVNINSIISCVCVCVCVCATSLQSYPTLHSSMGCSPPGSSVHGILQAGILEWQPCPPPGDLPSPGTKPASPAALALRQILYR